MNLKKVLKETPAQTEARKATALKIGDIALAIDSGQLAVQSVVIQNNYAMLEDPLNLKEPKRIKQENLKVRENLLFWKLIKFLKPLDKFLFLMNSANLRAQKFQMA